MNTTKISCFVFSFVFVFAGAAMAIDFVDIGNPTSEATHNLISWGPVEPATNPGSWGGIGSWTPPGTCRVIWSPADNSPTTPGSVDAFVDMTFSGGSELLSFKHLDGQADDTFEVWVGGNLLFTYYDDGLATETWYNTSFGITMSAGVHQVRFEAIGGAWSGWQTWGQVAFSEVSVNSTVPVDEDAWGNVKALYR